MFFLKTILPNKIKEKYLYRKQFLLVIYVTKIYPLVSQKKNINPVLQNSLQHIKANFVAAKLKNFLFIEELYIKSFNHRLTIYTLFCNQINIITKICLEKEFVYD